VIDGEEYPVFPRAPMWRIEPSTPVAGNTGAIGPGRDDRTRMEMPEGAGKTAFGATEPPVVPA
jgi:hypothetical protein